MPRKLHCAAGNHDWVMFGPGGLNKSCPEHRPVKPAVKPRKPKEQPVPKCTCNLFYDFHGFECPDRFLALPGMIGRTDIRLRVGELYQKRT